MIRKYSVLAALLTVTAAGALAAQAPASQGPSAQNAAVDPVGRFDVEVVMGGGQTGTGRLVINGAPGKYEGTLAADGGQGPLTVTSVTFSQDTALVSVASPHGDGGIVMHLKFSSSGFEGRFEGAENGQIKGKRIG